MKKLYPFHFWITQLLFLLFLLAVSVVPALGQCGEDLDLPDENQPVSNPAILYCVTFTIDPTVSGHPTGFSLNLQHEFQGDISIRVQACGETLMLLTRPGGGSCNSGAPAGSPAPVDGAFTFSDGGGGNPDIFLPFGGGAFGLSGDPCGVNTVNSFAQLAASCGNNVYELDFCIVDHFFAFSGFASNIQPIFPGSPPVICGCTNPAASNYDPTANLDDGSCEIVCIQPDPPSANGAQICQGQTASLVASGCSGTIRWFTAPAGGLPVNVGPTFNTPPLNTTTTYYIECQEDPTCPSNREPVVVEVTPPAPPALDPIGPFCAEDPPAPLPTSQGGVTGNWQGTGVTGNVFNPGVLAPGATVTLQFVPDPGQCAATASIQVQIQPAPFPVITGPTAVCDGQTVVLTAQGNFASYDWSTGDNLPSIAVSSPGTYSVTVTSLNGGCEGSGQYTLIEGTTPQPVITGPNAICTGQNAVLAVAGAFNSYQWSTGSTAPSIGIDQAGSYSVTVTNAQGCEGEADFFIEETFLAEPVLDGPDNLCSNQPSALSVLNAGEYVSFSWSTGSAGPVAPIPGPGVYTLTATNADGCTAEAVFAVGEFPTDQPEITGQLNICEGESTVLGVFPDYVSYVWTTGSNAPTTVLSNTTPVGVTVTDGNGCQTQTTAFVNVTPPPNVTLSGDQAICAGEPALISVDNSPLYLAFNWSTGESGPVIAVTSGGLYSVTVTDFDGCEGEAFIDIVDNQPPDATINGVLSICEGSTVLSANEPGLQYQWSTGSTAASITVSATGTYSLTVTDLDGCEASSSVQVTISDELAVAIVGDTGFCTGSSTLLEASSAFETYLWSDGSTGSSLEVSQPGTYGLTVTAASGCAGEASVAVVENALPTASITGDLAYCAGASTLLSAPPGLGYAWSDGSSAEQLSATAPGTYGLTVTDAVGCTDSTAVTVVENPLPEPAITGPLSFCEGDSSALGLSESYAAYVWSTGSTAASISVSAAGPVSVTVTDANGCIAADTAQVEVSDELTVAILGDTDYCAGSSTLLQASSTFASYLWSDGSTGSSLEVSQPGTYGLTVTAASGCAGEASVAVVENALPTASITGDLAYCAGGSTLLSAPPGLGYEWSDGSSAEQLAATAPGTYGLTVTDAAGCTDSTAVAVVENPLPEPAITGPLSFCEGDSSVLGLSEAYAAYAWSTGSTASSISVSAAGPVSVTVTDANGCIAADTVQVQVFDELTIAIVGDVDYCAGSSTLLEASSTFASYIWSDGSTGSSLEVDQPGTYGLTVTAASGCAGEASLVVVENALPTASITGDLAYCAGASTLLSAPPDLSYEWSDGSSAEQLSATAPGTYGLTVTDAAGCTDSTAVAVVENPLPEPAITGPLSFCEGDSSVLGLSESYAAYAWSTGSTAASISVSAAGAVSVTVTDANGCIAADTAQVEVSDELTVAILGDTDYCAGSSTLLQASSTFASYLWSDGSTGSSLEVSQPGTYGLTVTAASGCAGEASLVVVENALPTASITGDLAYCAGAGTLLSAPPGLGYAWSDGSSAEQLSATAPGTYGLTVTDAVGCTDSTAVAVVENPLPEPAISGPLSLCEGDSTLLGLDAAYAAYAWSTGSTAASISVTAAGAVSVTVTDANGCIAADTAQVEVSDELAVAIVGDVDYCAGSSTLLEASSTFASYIWSDGSTGSSLEVNQPGTYGLTVTAASGCAGEASLVVVENALPTASITGDLAYCAGGSTLLSAPPGLGYEWSDGSSAEQLAATAPGTYGLTVTDAAGCIDSTEVQVAENPLPVPSITGPAGICPGEEAVLGTAADYETYIWSTGQATPSISVAGAGTIALTVTDEQGCVGSDSLLVAVFSTAVPEIAGEPIFCPGTQTVLTAADGFASYAWSTGETAASLTVAQAGDYGLTVTDSNGCETENAVSASLYTVTEPVISGPAGFCAGSTASLSVAGGFEAFAWSNGAADSSIAVGQGGEYAVTVTDSNGCETTADFTLVQNSLPAVAIVGGNVFCPGGFTTLSADGVYAAYEWSDGSTAPDLQVNQAGEYRLRVTDENGCENEAALNVEEAEALSPVIEGDLAFCPGFSTLLSVGGSFAAYTWSDGSTGNELNVTAPGNYRVTVADAAGCEGEAEVAVAAYPAAAVVISGPNGFCTGESAALLAVGDGLASFDWSQGGTGTGITVAAPGVYTLIATDTNGCRDTVSTVIEAYPLPDFAISGQAFFCAGESTSLSASAEFAVYEWNGQPGGASLTADQPGTYTLAVTDSNGCRASQSLDVAEIALPTADAGSPELLTCARTEVTLGGSGSTTGDDFAYEWEGPGITPQNSSLPNPFVSEPGTYQLVVVDTVFRCASLAATTVVEQSVELPELLLADAEQLDCERERVLLDGSGSAVGSSILYSWYDDEAALLASGTAQLEVDAPGLYVFEVLDTLTGCRQIDSLTVVQDIEQPTAVAVRDRDLDCAVRQAVLSAQGSAAGSNIAYAWTDGQQGGISNSDTALVNAPGLYILSVTNLDNRCVGRDTVAVSEDITPPVADAGPPQQLDCLNPTAVLSGAGASQGNLFTYAWALGDTANVLGNGQDFTADAEGEYILVVTNTDNNCQALASVTVTALEAAPTGLGIAQRIPTCFGDGDGSISISGVEGGTPPYVFSFGGGPFSDEQQFSGLDGGTYALVVQDATGCEYETAVVLPEGNDLSLFLAAEISVQAGQSQSLNLSVNIPESEIADIRWQGTDELSCTDCLNPSFLALNSGLYQVSVTDVNGCTASARVQVLVGRRRQLFAPNVFSPNGDGRNDVFYLQAGPEVVGIRNFQVFSRWGDQVYGLADGQANDPQSGWDGTYRGERMNGGVFVWWAEVEFADGETELFKGDVVLMR